ncbi:pol polyprotein [Gossypium australe]|uniref:Pol polyprotein n=1 Tax=Gossypium australe TaxID=47621 RepID=A0A5B6VCQ4_9ROSI|nr:pol polyprotein [Gossypium australe]
MRSKEDGILNSGSVSKILIEKVETSTNSPNSQSGALVPTQASNQNSMLPVLVSHNEKPAEFSGQNFKTWQQKRLFYLSMLNLAKFLKDDPPTIKEGEVDDVTVFTTIEAWEHSNFFVKKTAKELRTSLDHKYKIEDDGTKKFLVTKFLNFVMVDSKLVVNQVQELQLINHEILAEGMVISEYF